LVHVENNPESDIIVENEGYACPEICSPDELLEANE
jgi:hypothetical protein